MRGPAEQSEWGIGLWTPEGVLTRQALESRCYHWHRRVMALPSGTLSVGAKSPEDWISCWLGALAAGRTAGVFPGGRPACLGTGSHVTGREEPHAQDHFDIDFDLWRAVARGSLVVATSGTTQDRRLYRRSVRSWLDQAAHEATLLGLTRADRFLMIGEPGYSLTQYAVMRAVTLGAAIGVIDPSDRLDDRAWLVGYAPTVLYGAPKPMVTAVRSVSAKTWASVCLIIVGGGDLSRQDRDHLHRCIPNATVIPFYGAAETGLLTMMPVDRAGEPDWIGTVGVVFPDVVLRPTDTGTWVKTPAHVDGWIRADGAVVPLSRSGDEVLISDRIQIGPRGRVSVLGRSDDVLRIGGVLVDPAVVEQSLTALETIDDAAVFPFQYRNSMILPAAMVVLAQGASVDRVLRRRIRAALRPEQRPRVLLRGTHALPRTATGKLDRGTLHAILRNQGIPVAS